MTWLFLQAVVSGLLLISGYYGDSKIIAETAAKLRIGVHALVGLANAAYSNPKFIAENRELTDQLFDGNYWHNPQSPRARAVFDAYQKRFSATMSNHGVQGYQVLFVLKDALERAASTDREKVREAIAKTNLADQRERQRHSGPAPGAGRQAGGGGPRALRGGQAGVPGPEVEGLAPLTR